MSRADKRLGSLLKAEGIKKKALKSKTGRTVRGSGRIPLECLRVRIPLFGSVFRSSPSRLLKGFLHVGGFGLLCKSLIGKTADYRPLSAWYAYPRPARMLSPRAGYLEHRSHEVDDRVNRGFVGCNDPDVEHEHGIEARQLKFLRCN